MMDSPQPHLETWPTLDSLNTALGQAAVASHMYKSIAPYNSLLVLAQHRNIALPTRALEISSPENLFTMIKLLRKPDPNPYYNYTVTELRALLKERGLTIGVPRIKRFYIEKLVNDDKTKPRAPFRFTDLPPELRNSIYELVLNETSRLTPSSYAPELIAEPALLHVSRAIRREALPIYYGNTQFCILLKSPPFKPFFLDSAVPIVPEICPDSEKWLNHLGQERLNMLRKISIEVLYASRMLILNIEIDPKKKDVECTIDRTCQYHAVGTPYCRRWNETKTLEQVFKMHREKEGQIVKNKDCLDTLNGLVVQGELEMEGFKKMVRDVGEMLWDLKHTIK